MSTNMPTTRGSSAACQSSCTVSMMSRDPPNRPSRNSPPPPVSDGTSRRSTDSTMFCGSVLVVKGPETSKAAQPPIPSRVRVPTVASRPTINRHMARLRFSSSGLYEIRPKCPYGVKHRRCTGVEPVVAHQHGGRLAAHRAQAVIETPHRQPQVGGDEGMVDKPDLELWPQGQPAKAHPDDVVPSDAA